MDLQDKSSGLIGINPKEFPRGSHVRQRYGGHIPLSNLKSKGTLEMKLGAKNEQKSNMTQEKSSKNAIYQDVVLAVSAQTHSAQTKEYVANQQGNSWDYLSQVPINPLLFKSEVPRDESGWNTMTTVPWHASGISMEYLQNMCENTIIKEHGAKTGVLKNRWVIKSSDKANRELQFKERENLAKAKVESWFKQTDKIMGFTGNNQESVGYAAERHPQFSMSKKDECVEYPLPNYNAAEFFPHSQTEADEKINGSNLTKDTEEWQRPKEDELASLPDADSKTSEIDRPHMEKEGLMCAPEYGHIYAPEKLAETDPGKPQLASIDNCQYYGDITIEQIENAGSVNYQGFDDTISLALTIADLKSSVIDAIPNIMEDEEWKHEGNDNAREDRDSACSQKAQVTHSHVG